ncbi:MAG: PEGA domain-containing protein [Cognaticolwellia sp.]
MKKFNDTIRKLTMLYILTSTETILNVDVRVQESRVGDSNVEGVLNLKLKQALTTQSFGEQQAYLTASATAAYVSFNKLDQRHRFRASVNLLACNNETYNFTQGSSSSGLGYALACFDAWWRINLQKSSYFTYPVFATGEILTSGQIKPIGHIVEKLESTCKYVEQNQDSISSFYLCYPQDNDKDIPDALRKRLEDLGGVLIPSQRLQYTLGQLLGDAYDGDPLGRWHPFKGLKSFDYEDSVRFFGRDKDVERLYSDIKQNSGLLIVSGASGTGKSSLIKAGLIPKLEQEHDELHWAYCTPNSLKEGQGVLRFILEQLLIAWDIKDQNIDELVSMLNHSIEEGITSLSSLVTSDTKQCLLYLDQYEEVFSQSEKDIESIGSELSIIDGLAKALPPLNIVLAIRNEYLGRLLDNQALRSPIISNVASQLTSQEWEAIVHEQALFSGITFEPEGENNEALDTIIIEEAIKTPYALPMVSFLLEQLYSKVTEEKTNTTVLQHNHYQALGGLTGAIAYRASTVLQESEASEKTTSTFFDYFVGVNPEGLPFARCVELADIVSNKPLYSLVKGFIDANLIVSVAADADSSAVKLAHDSLFTHWDALKKWIIDSKEYLLWRYGIDGQFTRWQQATANNKDYLLKDKQILKEGKAYLKLNLIRDSKLNEYLSTSLKQKSKKQLSVFFVFIILPLLIIGIYQWDKHRIKTYYYSAVGERWSVPFGINELTDEQVSHRTFSYKMEYQGGVLKRLSHVNSAGTLTKDESREKNALWEYQYTEQGRVQSVTVKSDIIKEVETINFQFNENNQAMASFNKSFGNKNFNQISTNQLYWAMNNFGTVVDTKTNSDISQHLLTYTTEGWLLKREYQNPYGTPTPLNNEHYGISYSYDVNGLNNTSFLLDKNGDLWGNYKTEYIYSLLGQPVEIKEIYKNKRVKYNNFTYDEWGNLTILGFFDSEIKNDYEGGVVRTHYEVNLDGSITKLYFTNISGNYVAREYGVAIQKMTHDENGRIADLTLFDEKEQPTYGSYKCHKGAFEYDDNGNVTGLNCYSAQGDLSLNVFGCATTKTSWNENNDIEEVRCFDQHSKPTLMDYFQSAFLKVTYDAFGKSNSLSFYGVDGKPTLNNEGFAKVAVKNNSRGHKVEVKFFGSDGSLIPGKDGSVMNKYKYDGRGNLIEHSLWGEDEKPVYIDGASKFKIKYDDLGREIETGYFDEFNEPVINEEQNYHKKVTKYSFKGNYIASINYKDENDNFIHILYNKTQQKIYPIKNTKILSTPEGAKVFIDNQFSGVTPFHKYVPLGKHELKIVKADYQELTSIINITQDEVHSSSFTLSIIAKPDVIDVQTIKEKASGGDLESQFQLGVLYLKDKTKRHDGIYWLKQSANLGYLKAQHQLANEYFIGKNIDTDNDQVIKYYLMAAKQNDLRAQYQLGRIYFDGRIQGKDFEKGVKWLLMAANGGYVEAQFYLANEYFAGNNIVLDDEEALKYFLMAAKQNHLGAKYQLGTIYLYGWGQDKDIEKAIKWLLMAANGGYVSAFSLLGGIYGNENYSAFKQEAAIYWYELGAELRDEASYGRLGTAYLFGEGVNQDTKNAVLWYIKALQSKGRVVRSDAASWLGTIYENGFGISSDFEKAISFYNEAIEIDGNITAVYNLANMYLQGLGVEVNYRKAVKLMKIAHSKGRKDATEWLTRNGEL